MSGTVHPFSCGTQALDWTERNCDRCFKSQRAEHHGPIDPKCDIERALGEAFFTNGTVSVEIAVRMGYTTAAANELTWDCPERDTRS